MIKFGRVIGANTDFLTAQAFIFPKTSSENGEQALTLALIISGAGDDVFTKVRQTAPNIEEIFFRQDQPVPARIENILDYLKKELQSLENLQILIACCRENVLYLLSTGAHIARLLREGNTLDLISDQKSGQLISGYIKDADKLLLLSSKLESPESETNSWDRQTITRLLNTQIDNLEEEANLIIQKSLNPEPIAAILIEKPAKVAIENAGNNEIFEDTPKRKINLPKITINPAIFKKIIPQSRKVRLILIAVAILAVLLSGALVYYQKMKSGQTSEQIALLQDSRDKLSKAQSEKDSDAESAQTKLKEAKYSIDDFLSKNPKNSEALELKKQIEDSTDSILRLYHVSDFPLFLSLDLIRQNFNTKRLSYSLGNTLFLDDKEKSLVLLDLGNKKNTILAGKTQLGDAKFASLNGENAFVYSQDKGVLKVDTLNQKTSVVAKPDTEWGKITDIYGFGGNVYLLDSLKNQIWKYVPTESGYSDRQNYLKEGQKLDFSGSKRLTIDYSVWVLKQGPEVFRFTGGASDSFSVGGMDQPLQEMQTFYVGEGGDDGPTSDKSFAYFLDSQNSRLVVLKKNGQYYAQYLGDKFKNATDFAVDEREKKIYLLEGGKIYQIELK